MGWSEWHMSWRMGALGGVKGGEGTHGSMAVAYGVTKSQ